MAGNARAGSFRRRQTAQRRGPKAPLARTYDRWISQRRALDAQCERAGTYRVRSVSAIRSVTTARFWRTIPMNAFAHRAPLALSFVYLASVLAGCNAGATSPAIPPKSAQSQFTRPQANAGGIKIWAAAEQSNKVFGLSSGAKRVLDVISTESQPV